jgi:hypothetical protein
MNYKYTLIRSWTLKQKPEYGFTLRSCFIFAHLIMVYELGPQYNETSLKVIRSVLV